MLAERKTCKSEVSAADYKRGGDWAQRDDGGATNPCRGEKILSDEMQRGRRDDAGLHAEPMQAIDLSVSMHKSVTVERLWFSTTGTCHGYAEVHAVQNLLAHAA
jgi:hypothetical protein